MVLRRHDGVGGDLRAVGQEPALEALGADGGQSAVGLAQLVGAFGHVGAVDEADGVRIITAAAGSAGIRRAHGQGGGDQRHRFALAVGGLDGQGVLALGQLAEFGGLVQLPQVEPGAAALAGGGGEAAAAAHRDHHAGDAAGVGDDAPQGEGGVALCQVVVDGCAQAVAVGAAGIEQARGGPAVSAGDVGQLPLGHNGGILGHGVRAAGGGVDEQVLAAAAIFQHTLLHRPELALAGGGGGQGHRAPGVGQACAVGGGEGVLAGLIPGQGQDRALAALHGLRTLAVHKDGLGLVGAVHQAILALGHGGAGVAVTHDQGIGGLVDMETAVDGGLDAAGVGVEVGHGAVLDAVFGGRQVLHILVLGLQLAALGVDGLDQVGLALQLEAAQTVGEGAVDDAGGAAHAVAAVGAGDNAHAVVDAAAPKHVFQGYGVVVDAEAGEQGLDVVHQNGVAVVLPEGGLGLGEFGAVVLGHLLPLAAEVAAEAGVVLALGVVGVGVIQDVAHGAVGRAVGLGSQPVHEVGHGLFHEHIDAVGRAAAVTLDGGDVAGISAVARLVVLAQRAQLRGDPVFVGGNQRRGQKACHQQASQHQRRSTFDPFHMSTPCLILCFSYVRTAKGPLHQFT